MITAATPSTLLSRIQRDGLFQGYAYSYPHKMAYRPLNPPQPLAEAWGSEPRDSLFLYAHIPFCGMRCGFCNLFTTTGTQAELPSLEIRYLDTLELQASCVAEFLPDATFSRGAIGGGTPTFLSMGGMERLFKIWQNFRFTDPLPLSVEMSPETVTAEKMELLRQFGTTRASVGVQSFVQTETQSLGRPQKAAVVHAALEIMREAGFPIRNLDLIYGTPGQTPQSWLESLRQALQHTPEEIFLYPLYVRPLTGLGRRERQASEAQADLYRQGRDFLLAKGYRQISMRLFRSPNYPESSGAEYCCQEDGMLGLGAGARSYTRRLHYSTDWAVGRETVSAILQSFMAKDARALSLADYGCTLDVAEERRRYLIKSILRSNGLDLSAYHQRFSTEAMEDFPQLHELVELGAASLSGTLLTPTQLGLEWSDVIGPWLYSTTMEARIRNFSLR